ncbi:MAG: hypothetical protein RO009_21505 [Pseudorhodoplanes sp.]|jgi:hypothetical protein|nr:hypothetical protein [Pseudorhodoplanes sp.]
MFRLLIAFAALAAVIGAPGEASAQYYDPYYRGYYPPPPPPPYYRAPAPRYRSDRLENFRPAYVDRHGQMTFYPRRGGVCPRGYTVQDGVCKPYRGY